VQWVGGARLYVTADHRYLGNVAQSTWPPPSAQTALESMASCLHRSTDLRGLIGIDYLHHSHVWPLEINPRPTASVEVLAEHLGRNLFVQHLIACDAGELVSPAAVADRVSQLRPPSPVVAKRVLYNGPHSLLITAAGFEFLHASTTYRPLQESWRAWAVPATVDAGPAANAVANTGSDLPLEVRLADIPWPQTVIPPHEPICTLLARVATGQIPASSSAEAAVETWRLLEQLEYLVLRSLRQPTSASDELP
jgi:predicted ATP-grasp superfamily ATP-dependent carboligase